SAMPADQSGWLNDHQCATPVEPAGQLRKHKPVGRGGRQRFLSRSRNRANCLRKNRFSAARAKRRRPIVAKKLKQSLTIVRRFRTSLGSRLKTLNIFAIVSRLTALISRADRIIA